MSSLFWLKSGCLKILPKTVYWEQERTLFLVFPLLWHHYQQNILQFLSVLPARPAFNLWTESSCLGHQITEGHHAGHSPKAGAPATAALAMGAAQLSSHLLLLSLRPTASPPWANLIKLQVPEGSFLFVVVCIFTFLLLVAGLLRGCGFTSLPTPAPSCCWKEQHCPHQTGFNQADSIPGLTSQVDELMENLHTSNYLFSTRWTTRSNSPYSHTTISICCPARTWCERKADAAATQRYRAFYVTVPRIPITEDSRLH